MDKNNIKKIMQEGHFESIQKEAERVDQKQSGSLSVGENEFGYPVRENYLEGRAATDDINNPQKLEVFSEEETEKTEENEIVKKWIDQYLPSGVLEEYALSYVKNKKSKKEKKKNKKYEKYYQKAERELKPKLAEFLNLKIKKEDLKEDADDDEIKNTIYKTLNSDMHANRLLKSVHKYLESDEFSKKIEEDNEAVNEIEDQKSVEAPKTESEFFEKYKRNEFYVNALTGAEFKILAYNPDNQEIELSIYQAHFYNSETEAHEFISEGERDEQKIMNYSDFRDFFAGSFLGIETEEVAQEQDKIDKIKNKEELGGIWINDNGERIDPLSYLRNKNSNSEKNRKWEQSVTFKDRNFKNDQYGIRSKSSSEDWQKMLDEQGYEFYKNESELISNFKKEFGEYQEKNGLVILGFEYNPEAKKYLAKIKEPNQKETKLVTIKELREIVKNLPQENSLEEEGYNEAERILIGGYERLLKDQEKIIEERVWKNHKRKGGYLETKDCIIIRGQKIIGFINDHLLDMIKEKVNSNVKLFSTDSMNKVLNHFKAIALREEEIISQNK